MLFMSDITASSQGLAVTSLSQLTKLFLEGKFVLLTATWWLLLCLLQP